MARRASVAVVGTSHMDFIAYVDDFPEPGETVLGKGFATLHGGKGANQAVAASRLGAICYLISKVGDDFVGESIIENAVKNGVVVDYLKKDARSHSGVALIYVSASGENMIAVAPGVDSLVSEDDVVSARDAIASSDVVVAQLEIPVKTAEFSMRFAKGVGRKTLLNPAPASELSEGVLRYVDFITPNRAELAKLSGMKVEDDASISEAAGLLLERGVGCVLVTLGKRGSMVVTRSIQELVPAYEVKAVDTVGAGDAFNGALAVALSAGCDVLEAARFANLVAALKVTRRGAQSGLPTFREVADFVSSRGLEELNDVLVRIGNANSG